MVRKHNYPQQLSAGHTHGATHQNSAGRVDVFDSHSGSVPSHSFIFGPEDPDSPPGGQQDRYSRHVRFEQGGMTVLARARSVPSSRSAAGAAVDGKYRDLADMVRTIHADRARATAIQAALTGVSERVPGEGGFLVGEELRQELMLLTLEQAIIRPRAIVLPMGEVRTSVPVIDDTTHAGATVLGGLDTEWAEEGTSLTGLAATFGRVTLEARKLAAYTALPSELWQDSAQLDAFLRVAIPAAWAWAEDQAFINGSGAGQPLGILSATCQIQVDRQTSSAVTFTDLVNMVDRMLPQSLTSFIWLVSPDVLKQLLSIFINFGAATSGVIPPPDWLRYSDQQNCWVILGRPCYPTEHVPALGSTGDVVAVDPRFFVVGDRMEMTIDTAAAGQGFIKDEVELRIVARLDGRIWGPSEPVTPANSSETTSPVVILNAAT
jgi:hypothetical protein